MKKKLAMLTALALIVTLFAACGGGNNNTSSGGATPAGQVAIQWYTPNWNEQASREMADEFMAENPDVKVELVITDWETYRSRVTTAASGNNAPELFTVLLTDVKPLSDMGLLAPLNDLGRDAGIGFDDIIDAALNITTINGEIYAVPFRYDGSGIFYNVDILSAAGYDSFPETWDDMIAMSADLSSSGNPAFAWPLGNQAEAVTRLIQQLYNYGGDILNEDETVCLLDSDNAKRALNNIVTTIQNGYASSSSPELNNTLMRNMFGSGQLAFNFTGPFDIDVLTEEYPDLNFRTAVIPGNGGMGITTANGWCVAMGGNAANKEAGARFLAYITLPDNQIRLTDSFPASKTAIEYEQFSSEYLKPFAQQLTSSRAEPTYTRWAEIEPIIFNYIQQAVAGTMSVEDACDAMAKDVTTLLSY